MKNKFLLISLFLTLGGCATEMSGPDSGPHAPTTGKPGAGVVAYNPDGLKELVDSRRGNALSRMHDACHGNYKITKEEVRTPAKGEPESLATFAASRLNYISYECLSK